MTQTNKAHKFRPENNHLVQILVLCGILSSVLYIMTDIIVSLHYAGYSIIDQNYSELLATGAPTRSIMLIVSVVYNLLVACFAAGLWLSVSNKRAKSITSIAMLIYAILSMVTPSFFQMDMRGANVTPLGSLHPLMTAIMSLFILLSIGSGAFIFGKTFRFYSFITIAILLIFGFLTSLQAPLLEAGKSTPWMGFTERINIYTTMLWFGFLSVNLFKSYKRNKE
jgi:hypothetical protein